MSALRFVTFPSTTWHIPGQLHDESAMRDLGQTAQVVWQAPLQLASCGLDDSHTHSFEFAQPKRSPCDNVTCFEKAQSNVLIKQTRLANCIFEVS